MPVLLATSTWIRVVQAERDLSVDRGFVSLRLIDEHAVGLARFPGFAELECSLREPSQLAEPLGLPTERFPCRGPTRQLRRRLRR